ncbi:hypothetical protein ACFX2H_027692 [Malus domestica]
MGSHFHYLGLAQFRHWTPSAYQFLNWTKWVGGLVAPLVLRRGNRCQKEEEIFVEKKRRLESSFREDENGEEEKGDE